MHWRRKRQPTQYSCLENPRDGGPCWAAVYGVAQSWTQLKRLSSSSSKTLTGASQVVLVFSKESTCQCRKVKSLSRVQLLATPWTTAYQAPPPMGFSRQEYWSGVPLPSQLAAAAAANSLQSCPTLCDPIDGSPPGSSIHGIFQARVQECDAIAFSIQIRAMD